MKKNYQSFKLDTGGCGSQDRFATDTGGAGRGVPAEGGRKSAGQAEQAPYDPPRYWEFFPGTD
jgi:hypothetical protein